MSTEEKPITPEQSRAARGLLDWSQTQLATSAGLSESTVRNFERGERKMSTRPPSPEAVAAIQKALVGAGIELLPSNGKGPGVRIAKGSGKHPEQSETIPVVKAKRRSAPRRTKKTRK